MKIYAPVKDFNGLRNNVRFVDGVGETNDRKAAEWFKRHGYKVALEPIPIPKVESVTNDSEFVEINKLADESDKPDFEDMTPNEIREWAKANGYGFIIKGIRNKEKLIELIGG